jgi:hypothetical protein
VSKSRLGNLFVTGLVQINTGLPTHLMQIAQHPKPIGELPKTVTVWYNQRFARRHYQSEA